MIADEHLKYVFWGLAAIGLTAVVYSQYEADTEGDQAIIATGMAPQIELMRNIADQSGWKVTCEGTSGEMTALRIAPGFWADDDVDDAMFEQMREVSSTTETVFGINAIASDCDVLPVETSSEGLDGPMAVAFGTQEELVPYADIARSCGLENTSVAPISEFYMDLMEMDPPDDQLALYLEQGSEDRFGPVNCFIIMSLRHESATTSDTTAAGGNASLLAGG